MTAIASPPQYGIKHNHSRGNVADYLAAKLADGSRVSVMSVVSVYFAIYAYEALSKELDSIESLRFIQSLDPDKTDKKMPLKLRPKIWSLPTACSKKKWPVAVQIGLPAK